MNEIKQGWVPKDWLFPKLLANQFVSLWSDATIYEKMSRDGELGNLLTGGGIVHIQTDSKLTSNQAEKIIEYAAEKGCAHFAINCTYTKCEDCNTVVKGNLNKCPKCGKEHLSHYSRVIGYFSKVEDWNPTRKTYDFPNRKFADLTKIKE